MQKMVAKQGCLEQLNCQLFCAGIFLMVTVNGQDDFGGDDSMDMDMDSLMGGQGGKAPGATTAKPVQIQELTHIEQSTRALQQFALVIGNT